MAGKFPSSCLPGFEDVVPLVEAVDALGVEATLEDVELEAVETVDWGSVLVEVEVVVKTVWQNFPFHP